MTAVTVPAVAQPSDLLRMADLTPAGLLALLDQAAVMKGDPRGWTGAHAGKSLACFFEKPSTRTRVSLEAAAHRLGMLPVMLRPEELQLGRGELLEDTARVLAGYCSAIAMRVFSHGTLERVAAAAEVPVINLLSDDHHPCQALADLLTIRERFGRLLGRRIAYVGDGNNVAHSLLEAAPLAGMDIALACPPGYWPDAEIVYAASRQARKVGTEVIVVDDPREAAAGAHAVYTDVWVSMGEEGEQSERLTDLAGYRVTPELMAAARPEAVFMHCLPAHRGQEVDAAVIDGPASVVFEQAANRLPTEQAVLHTLLTRAPA